MSNSELIKRMNSLMRLQAGLMDALVGLPDNMSGKVSALLDDTWREMRAALDTYYEGR